MQPQTKTAASVMLVVNGRKPLSAITRGFEHDARWDVEFAENLDAAVEKLHVTRCDVVLVYLTVSSWAEFAGIRILRAADPDVKIILFVEQQATIPGVVEAIREHAFAIFCAPFNADDACHMIMTAAALSDWTNGIEVLSAAPEYLTLRLRCALHTADRLVQFMKEAPIELADGEKEETTVAFRELLLNAIEHGGKLDPQQWVRVSRIRTRRTLVFHIVDPGEGFCRSDLPHAAISNPTDPFGHVQFREQTGVRPGGFGMLIATRMVDEVIYNEQGNQVILIKHLD
jgi:anti-sigma regulatory factor (Ser/Thr protein kinase)/ActR/RegA family two-component response regulator